MQSEAGKPKKSAAVPRQAQAQAQEEAIISVTESLELVQCLLRVSVFHVAFLRGLFPDGHFKGTSMDNLEGMEIKMLRPKCSDSERLIEWVEQGVKDAIQKMYLKTLFFGISLNPEGSKLLEEYIFSFGYDKDGAVSMKLTTKGRQNKSSGPQASLTSVRYQVIRLMRMLVQLCNTLERVPEERYLFMKLAYNESTPDDYEPPLFQAREEGEPPHFARKPFSMEVGSIATNYHAVSLRLKSVLDGCGEVEGEEPYVEQQDSAIASHDTGLTSATFGNCCKVSSMRRQPSVIQEEDSCAGAMSCEGAAPESSATAAKSGKEKGQSRQPRSMDTDVTFDPAVEQVKKYCLGQQEVDLPTTALHFKDMAEQDLSRALDQLVIDGLLKKTRTHTFKVSSAKGASQAVNKPREDAPRFDPALRDIQGMGSEAGRASLFGGSLQSGQPSVGPKTVPQELREAEQQECVVFDSQQSEQCGKKRKASYVLQPIHQRHRGPGTRARTRLGSMCR